MAEIKKNFVLPIRGDFVFKIANRPPTDLETVVSTTLPIYLTDASLPRPDHKDKLSTLGSSFKRLAVATPSVSFKLMKKILLFQRKYIFPEFQPLETLDDIDTLRWIHNINQPYERKRQLLAVYEKITAQGTWQRPGMDDENPLDCESFIKDEPYEALKAHRWINASLDEIKVIFGPIADKAMHILVSHDDFIKTVPVVERAKAIHRDLGGYDAVGQSTDATSMEDHYARYPSANHSPMHRIHNEFMLYLVGAVLPPTPLIESFEGLWYKTTRHADPELTTTIWNSIRDSVSLGIFFRHVLDGYRRLKMRNFGHVIVNAILCSGEMNTSFKNGCTMRTMVKYAAYDLEKPYLKGDPKDCHQQLLRAVRGTKSKHEGDDSLAVYPRDRPDDQWWLRHGWVIKVEFVGPINEASFCGLVYDELDLKPVPNIRAALAKFGWTNRRYARSGRGVLMGLLRSKAISMKCEYGDVPVLGAFAHRIINLTRHVKIRKSIIDQMDLYERERFLANVKTFNENQLWQRPPAVGEGTRRLVERLQNIGVSQQLEIERELSVITGPFSVPQLDFDPVWIHNQTRTTTNLKTPKTLNIPGRLAVTEYLKSKISVDCKGQKPNVLRRMLRELTRLGTGEL